MRIVVAGAGPAGVAIAVQLAGLGHDVTVLAPPGRRHAVEGVSFRVLDGLRVAGLAEALPDPGRPVPRAARWNGGEDAAGHEWLVDRAVFDAALLRAAGRVADCRMASLTGFRDRPDGLEIRLRAPGGGEIVQAADFLVDARGRGAPGGRPRLTGPGTVALCRRYARADALPRGSWVESCAGGWAWLAVPGDGTALLQLSTAAPRGALAGRRDLVRPIEAMLDALPGMAALLRRADRPGPVLARLATPGMALEPAAGRWLRTGDAALAIDPLSGHGVFEAIAGALAAAAVVNTILGRPEDAGLARAFLRERAHRLFRDRALAGQAQYRREERWIETPFWAERQAWSGAAEPDRPAPPAAAIETRAVIDQGWIRARRVVVTTEMPRGTWRLDGVELAALVDLLDAEPSTDPERAARALGCSRAAASSALAWLDRCGLRPGAGDGGGQAGTAAARRSRPDHEAIADR